MRDARPTLDRRPRVRADGSDAVAAAPSRAAAGATQPRATRRGPVWTRERVIAELKAVGTGPAPSLLRTACCRLFGSVSAARQAAGVARPVAARRPRRVWTREEITAELRRLDAEGRRPLPGPLLGALRPRFGTLEAARLAAGLPAGSPAPARDARAFEQRWERFAAACERALADVLAPPPELCALPADAISRGRPDLVRSSAPLLIALLAGRAELLGYSMRGARPRELAATVAALAELGVPLPDELRTLSASWARPPRRHR